MQNAKRKTYRKSDNCELVYTPLSWNIQDSEQFKDLQFVESSTNRSRKIKECVRLVRLWTLGEFAPLNLSQEVSSVAPASFELDDASLDDSLSQLID